MRQGQIEENLNTCRTWIEQRIRDTEERGDWAVTDDDWETVTSRQSNDKADSQTRAE